VWSQFTTLTVCSVILLNFSTNYTTIICFVLLVNEISPIWQSANCLVAQQVHVNLNRDIMFSSCIIYVIILVHPFVNSQQLLQVEGLGKITPNEFTAAILDLEITC
jgi:hypothetical protein